MLTRKYGLRAFFLNVMLKTDWPSVTAIANQFPASSGVLGILAMAWQGRMRVHGEILREPSCPAPGRSNLFDVVIISPNRSKLRRQN
jgi:hypothetical protein